MSFSDFISFITCVAALAAVYYSYQSVCLSAQSSRDDFNNRRPLLSVEENDHALSKGEIKFITKIRNYGYRPAKKINFQSILILENAGKLEIQTTDGFTLLELAPQGWTNFYVYKFPEAKTKMLKYYVIKLSYEDSASGQIYFDSFIRFWDGTNFTIPSIEGDAKIRDLTQSKEFLKQ